MNSLSRRINRSLGPFPGQQNLLHRQKRERFLSPRRHERLVRAALFEGIAGVDGAARQCVQTVNTSTCSHCPRVTPVCGVQIVDPEGGSRPVVIGSVWFLGFLEAGHEVTAM